jgi:DNA polymerase I-like protein with 3'-5' exonuclease and polymerase domains
MILDHEDEIDTIIKYIKNKRTLLVPILCSPVMHSSINPLCAIYIYTEDDVERLIPIRHTEQIRGFTVHVSKFLELENIFVHDKKTWLHMGGNTNVWDVKTLWWYTYNEAYDETHYPTPAHKFYWNRHQSIPQINTIVPLQQHLAMCQKIRKYAWPMCMNAELSDSYQQFNATYPEVFAEIEKNGLQVDETFRMPELIHEGRVYSNYNYHTTTGRPSNAYRGFNFAAMNKEDGTRSAFCSRFDQGALVEMDFDSYHVRLIARIIGYELPVTSIHDYLGQYYFGETELTDEQRNESKSITFRLLYGGIDREFLSIPFFQEVNDYVYKLWATWKSTGCIETPLTRRKICKDAVKNMTANKLFNYYLQAVETEVSVQKLRQCLAMLNGYETKMILYTYDSVLFDVPVTEAKEILTKIKNILQQGNFPVKVSVGNIYSKMNTITI